MAEISKITLPSGNSYDIKDATARNMITGGMSFNVVWMQSDYTSTTAPSASKLATIPSGVVVYYNSGSASATGTLAASSTTKGKFYLIYSKTQSGTLDKYDEYVTIGEASPFSWEKIGDTLMDLSDLGALAYKDTVSLNKQTDVVLGEATTFALSSGTVTHGTPTTKNAIGASSTFTVTQPTVSLSHSQSSSTGAVEYITQVDDQTAWMSTNYRDPSISWSNKDLKSVSTGVSATTKKLELGSVTGVQSTTTTASKATAGTSQTTATGAGTTSTTNTDWLKGVSVNNEELIIGAATLNTQSTTQYTFSDVTVPIKAASATTVATGSTVDSGDGASVVTSASSSGTASVIGASSTLSATGGQVSLVNSTTSGDVEYLPGITAYTEYLTASASGGNVAWNSKDTVSAVTGMPASTVGTGITVGTNDKVTALTNSTSVTVS